MGKILDIFKNTPHIGGTAICSDCGEEWVAVAPVGAFPLECPKCRKISGCWKLPISYSDELHWRCPQCQNEEFSITQRFIYCPKCGEKQEGLLWENV